MAARTSAGGEPDNGADLISRGRIAGTIEFDFTVHVGAVESQLVISDPGAYIHVRLIADGTGGASVRVEASGYVERSNAGPRPLAAGSHHLEIIQASEEFAIYIDGVPLARFAGSVRPNSILRSSLRGGRLPMYDDFNDNTIDMSKWVIEQDPSGQGVAETDGRLVLYATASGGSRTQSSRTTTSDIHGARWTQAYLDNGRDAMNHFAEITNGTDYIRVFINSHGPNFDLVLGGAYGSGIVTSRNATSVQIDVRERNGNIEILYDGTITHTIANKQIALGSYFRAFANHFGDNADGYGDKRMAIDDVVLYTVARAGYAQLDLDNVQGTFALPNDPIARLYDDFNDSEINRNNWHAAGIVEKVDQVLRLPLFLGGQPVTGFASTAGTTSGMNIRGFRLGSNRTGEPRRLCCWDTAANFEITNGTDFIRIEWNLKEYNRFDIVTGGAYAASLESAGRPRIVPVIGPNDENSDGPWDVRERDGKIEVLHNRNVKLEIPGTIRAGSYFQFKTHGNPFGQNMTDPPGTFYAMIDDLELYFDRKASPLRVTPTLSKESDTGPSDADHITNQTALAFKWPAGPEGSLYQWREGKLLDDGTVEWCKDWQSPQSQTTATTTVCTASVHVVSVRPVSADGIVGEATSRGFIVDVTKPASPPGLALSADSDPNGDGLTSDSTPTFMWRDATDDHGIAGYRWRLDGSAWSVLRAEMAATPIVTGDGSHIFEVIAVDLAGNEGPISTSTLTLDTTPPTLANMPLDQTAEATGPDGAFVTFSSPTASDNIDPEPTIECSPASGSTFALGGTTVICTATDDAGNSGSKTFKVTVQDTIAPLVALSAASFSNDTTPTVTVSASDGGSGVPNGTQVRLDVDLNNDGDFADVGESGYNMATLTSGSATFDVSPALAEAVYRLRARLSDQATNEGISSISTIVIDVTSPVITGSRIPAANSFGWNNADVTVSFSCADALSGLDTNTVAGATVTAEGSNQSVTNSGSCTDKAGNAADAATVSGIHIDKTGPVITFVSRTPANTNGWNNSDVTVNWNCADVLSGPVSTALSRTVTTGGANQAASQTCVDLADNTASDTRAGINIDLTPPSSTALRRAGSEPNAHGWNNSNVTVGFSASDALSGIDFCSPDVTLSDEGASQSASGTCTDKAGNVSATATLGGINIDKTPPKVLSLSMILTANKRAVGQFLVNFDEDLIEVAARDTSLYRIASASGRDKQFGTADDTLVTINPPTYDPLADRVNLIPRKRLNLHKFFHVKVTGAGLLTDLADNVLDGDGDGRPGGDYIVFAALGTRFFYTDSNGDTVSLSLTGGGVMELTRRADGEGQDLRLLNLNASTARNVLTATVRKPQRGGDGMTTLTSITPTTGYTKRGDLLNPSKFKISPQSLAAAVVDDLLVRGELGRSAWAAYLGGS